VACSLFGVCEKTAVENELSLSLTDLFDAIRDVREIARDLEKDLSRVLYRVRPDGEPRASLSSFSL
jgi:hypothetical protein